MVEIGASALQLVGTIQSKPAYRAFELLGQELLLSGLPDGVSVSLRVNNVFTNLHAGQECLATALPIARCSWL